MAQNLNMSSSEARTRAFLVQQANAWQTGSQADLGRLNEHILVETEWRDNQRIPTLPEAPSSPEAQALFLTDEQLAALHSGDAEAIRLANEALIRAKQQIDEQQSGGYRP